MDVEDELRRAMAEQVADERAPRSLASDVRRRHRRRKARIRTAVTVAGASVVALALIPTYRTIQPMPAGAPGTPEKPPAGAGSSRESYAPDRPSAPATPAPSSPKATASPDPRATSPTPVTPDERTVRPPTLPSLPAWMTYLPDGLTAAGPCATEKSAARTTTTCEWRGKPGQVRVRLVKGAGLGGPADLAPMIGVPSHTSVRGAPALVGSAPGAGRQVSWVARPGVGVTVRTGGAVTAELMRIAKGIRP